MTLSSDTVRGVVLALVVVSSIAVAGVAVGGATETNGSASASVHEAIEYGGTVELALDSGTDSPIEASNVDVWVDGESKSVGVDRDGTDGRVVLTGLSDVDPSQTLVVNVDQQGDLVTGNVTATVSGSVLKAGRGDGFFPGAQVAYVASDTDVTFDITRDGQYVVARGTGENSRVYVFDTADMEIGPTYRIEETQGGSATTKFVFRDLGLIVEAGATDVSGSDPVTATVTSNGSDRPVFFRLIDARSDEVVSERKGRIGNDGTGSVSFEDPPEGTYVVEVEDVITGITADTDSITVGEGQQGSIQFSRSVVTDHRGDVAAVGLEFTGEMAGGRADVTLGSEDVNFRVELSVEDGDGDGSATLYWNTADSDNATGGVWVTGGSVVGDVDVVTAVTEPVVSGEYPVSVAVGGQETDLATVAVEDRSTDGVTVMTASGQHDGFDGLADLASAATPADAVALDDRTLEHDWVVVRIRASGLGGYVESIDDVAGSNHGLSLSIEEADATVEANEDRVTADASDATLFADPGEDTYYVAFEPEHDLKGVEPGDELAVTFRVDADANDVTSSSEEVTTTVEIAEGSISFDTQDDEVIVPAEQGATVRGSTTYAPGTELSITLRREGGDAPFVKHERNVVVAANGTWAATFDLSDRPDGQTFTARASKADAVRATADGRVDAAVDEPTSTGEVSTSEPGTSPTQTDERTETRSESGPTADGTEATPTTAPTTAPGFGWLHAVVTLLASIVALRRRG